MGGFLFARCKYILGKFSVGDGSLSRIASAIFAYNFKKCPCFQRVYPMKIRAFVYCEKLCCAGLALSARQNEQTYFHRNYSFENRSV